MAIAIFTRHISGNKHQLKTIIDRLDKTGVFCCINVHKLPLINSLSTGLSTATCFLISHK
jgi:hypothetical protein